MRKIRYLALLAGMAAAVAIVTAPDAMAPMPSLRARTPAPPMSAKASSVARRRGQTSCPRICRTGKVEGIDQDILPRIARQADSTSLHDSDLRSDVGR